MFSRPNALGGPNFLRWNGSIESRSVVSNQVTFQPKACYQSNRSGNVSDNRIESQDEWGTNLPSNASTSTPPAFTPRVGYVYSTSRHQDPLILGSRLSFGPKIQLQLRLKRLVFLGISLLMRVLEQVQQQSVLRWHVIFRVFNKRNMNRSLGLLEIMIRAQLYSICFPKGKSFLDQHFFFFPLL